MSLAAGTRIGLYEVVALIGVGGMGEVYRATDTVLKRQVALKVLPEAVAGGADQLARFKREAEVLASLNHPNIAAIHGLERGTHTALVMELVEGMTLADRLAHGSVPLDETLAIARQIAEALEAAHERGIIHRDLKPANIKLRPDGMVKVLDFGLAKAMEPSSGAPPDVSHSPTITNPAVTRAGMILGTAAYMSPEQARGKPVDRRADVWAFGVVVYEMLAGRRAFAGDSVTEILAAVMHTAPDWNALPAATPAPLRAALELCLQKDPGRRLRDIADVRLVMEVEEFERPRPAIARRWTASSTLWPLAIGTVVGGLVALSPWAVRGPAPARVVRTTLTFADAQRPVRPAGGPVPQLLAVTPDGRTLIYVRHDYKRILARSLDAIDPTTVVTSASDMRDLAVDPTGQWVGYIDAYATLKKVSMTGGPAVTLTGLDGPSRGIAWMADDTIVFATSAPTTGLQRVSADGGSPTVLTRVGDDEADHVFPDALPGNRGVLFTILPANGGAGDTQVAVLDLSNNTRKTLLRGARNARYAPSGHLVYEAGASLRAVPFDLAALEPFGTGVEVLPAVVSRGLAIADDGSLVYYDPASAALPARTLVWVDREGRETPVGTPSQLYQHPRLSPDGTRIAVGAARNLWLIDSASGRPTQLTFGGDDDWYPVWLPGGRELIFGSRHGTVSNIYKRPANGTGAAVRLTESPNMQFPIGVTPDGGTLLFYELNVQQDVRQLALNDPGSGEAETVLGASDAELNGVVSPDGRWLAYEADGPTHRGQIEVFVRPYPEVGDGLWRISDGGGTHPVWSATGRELFYLSGDRAMTAVAVDTGASTWVNGTAQRLFETTDYFTRAPDLGRQFDVTADGQRFLMLKDVFDPATPPPRFVLVQGWEQELRRLVPVD